MDQKGRNRQQEGETGNREKERAGKREEKRSVTSACLEDKETDPRQVEIPENGLNVDYRHIYI